MEILESRNEGGCCVSETVRGRQKVVREVALRKEESPALPGSRVVTPLPSLLSAFSLLYIVAWGLTAWRSPSPMHCFLNP